MNKLKRLIVTIFCFISLTSSGQESLARQWNEVLLEAIRNDFARPTVHARNLFHTSAAMYDAWAIFNEDAEPYLLGNEVHGFVSEFEGFESATGSDLENLEKAVSYAASRIIEYRFQNSPGVEETMDLVEALFVDDLGLDPSFVSTDYSTGSSAALGNYIAAEYIKYGLTDGSNEVNDYENQFYSPSNEALFPEEDSGNPTITDPNKWQPLEFSTFVDQSGQVLESAIPDFLGPEWGIVNPFSLQEEDANIYQRDGFDYWVYHDPGPPPFLDSENDPEGTEVYQWNFSMVAVWSGHLDSNLETEIDISPASFGNFDLATIPTDFADHDTFYDFIEGGDASMGRDENPFTGQPYETQIVKLGDYARILAEFWADGPDSETPPGHWFTILNYVSDNLDEKRFNGQGDVLSDLEWDLKSYFTLGGTLHDVAITSWGIKGYYDYVRPISAIRYMADQGQSSDESLSSYNPNGIMLVDGYIELVEEGDPLAGSSNENVGKIKLFAWRGPDYIANPETDEAGVDWILAENWWPYQRPTFITPNFAGYVSGHSTFSRAAAECLTLLTGSPFFPNGLGEFEAPMNEFLVFEEGPSEDIKLQWATYRDASDQTSLSRIWGGIHPPADDIPGRIIGEQIGQDAFQFASAYFNQNVLGTVDKDIIGLVYPNPVNGGKIYVRLPNEPSEYTFQVWSYTGQILIEGNLSKSDNEISIESLSQGSYILKLSGPRWETNHHIIKK